MQEAVINWIPPKVILSQLSYLIYLRTYTAADEYLRTMQSLAAHLKLLLDTSEHLWRLLEQKRYLHAAWLFLLSRVVYLSLTRDADGDEEGWDAKGVNVLVCHFIWNVIPTCLKVLGRISFSSTAMGSSISISVADYSQGHSFPAGA